MSRFKRLLTTLDREFPAVRPVAGVMVNFLVLAGCYKLGMVVGDWLFPSNPKPRV